MTRRRKSPASVVKVSMFQAMGCDDFTIPTALSLGNEVFDKA